jgi:hypothetical protein
MFGKEEKMYSPAITSNVHSAPMCAVSNSTVRSPKYLVRWFRNARRARILEYKNRKWQRMKVLSRQRHPSMDERTWRALVNAELCPEHSPDCMTFKSKKRKKYKKGSKGSVALCTCGYDSLYANINSILADFCEHNNLYVEIPE